MCLFKVWFVAKLEEHILQLMGFFFSCTKEMCFIKVPLNLKFVEHILQLNSFLSECMNLVCFCKYIFLIFSSFFSLELLGNVLLISFYSSQITKQTCLERIF